MEIKQTDENFKIIVDFLQWKLHHDDIFSSKYNNSVKDEEYQNIMNLNLNEEDKKHLSTDKDKLYISDFDGLIFLTIYNIINSREVFMRTNEKNVGYEKIDQTIAILKYAVDLRKTLNKYNLEKIWNTLALDYFKAKDNGTLNYNQLNDDIKLWLESDSQNKYTLELDSILKFVNTDSFNNGIKVPAYQIRDVVNYFNHRSMYKVAWFSQEHFESNQINDFFKILQLYLREKVNEIMVDYLKMK